MQRDVMAEVTVRLKLPRVREPASVTFLDGSASHSHTEADSLPADKLGARLIRWDSGD